MQAALTVEGLCKRFGPVQAVDSLSLRIPEGICFGLLGPNGAGKTTTLELLEGLQKPDAGTIRYAHTGTDDRRYENLGIQFQATALPDNLTVANTLHLFRALYRNGLSVGELTELCQLQAFMDRRTSRLSGGQRQRVLLALALVNDPPLVFLDEPTTGLDPQARRHVWSVVRRILGTGKTVVLTTHYMEEAQTLCDRVGIMDHGRLIADDRPEALIRSHCPGVTVSVPEYRLPEALRTAWSGTLEGNTRVFRVPDPGPVLQTLMDADVPLDALSIRSPDLNDVFLELTGAHLRT